MGDVANDHALGYGDGGGKNLHRQLELGTQVIFIVHYAQNHDHKRTQQHTDELTVQVADK